VSRCVLPGARDGAVLKLYFQYVLELFRLAFWKWRLYSKLRQRDRLLQRLAEIQRRRCRS